jgi:hypothetical protein
VAIVKVEETFANRSLAMDARFQADLSRQFIVVTDTINTSVYEATSATGIPAFGDPHPESQFANATMVSASGKQDANNPFIWIIDCKYSTNPDAAQASGAGGSVSSSPEVSRQQKGVEPGNREANPLLRPADIQLSTGFMNFVLEKDFNSSPKKVVNTAGDLFAQPLMFRFPYLVINASRNTQYVQAANLQFFVDKVNNSSLSLFGGTTGIYSMTIGAGDLLIDSISGQRVLENNVSYWRVSMVIHAIVPNSWSHLPENESPGFDARLRNVGFNGKESNADASFRRLMGPDGQPSRVPFDLDQNGIKITGSTSPYYVKFRTHPRANLSWVNTFLNQGAF